MGTNDLSLQDSVRASISDLDPALISDSADVNMGQKILVRLRPAHSPDSFLPEEDVVGTMLHEVSHLRM